MVRLFNSLSIVHKIEHHRIEFDGFPLLLLVFPRSSATPDRASTWHAAFSTEVTSSPRTATPPSRPSRLSEL